VKPLDRFGSASRSAESRTTFGFWSMIFPRGLGQKTDGDDRLAMINE